MIWSPGAPPPQQASPLMLSADSVVDLPIGQAFGLFGSEEMSGWLFGARCDRLAVGSPVRIALPVGSGSNVTVEILGRFSRIRDRNMIAIEHVQPWRGELRVSFQALGAVSTRVHIRASLHDTYGIDWLARQIGLDIPPPTPTDAVRVGVLTHKSGPGAVYAMNVEFLAEMAVDEVNATGGIGGRQLELMVTDDATEPGRAAAEAVRMARAGCRAIFACTTSANFAAIDSAIKGRDILLVQPAINEGGAESATTVRLGERPSAQISALAAPLMKSSGGRFWFLIGQQYRWSYGAHRAARKVIAAEGGKVVGQSYSPLGTTMFTDAIARIQKSGADLVMSSLIGADEIAFQRQCVEAGLRSTTQMVSLVMDESTYEHIDPATAGEIWTALAYFEGAADSDDSELLTRYRQRYGRWAPPVTTLSETVYEAVLQYARILASSPDDPTREHARRLRQAHSSTRPSTVGTRDLTSQRLYLARTRAGALQIFDHFG